MSGIAYIGATIEVQLFSFGRGKSGRGQGWKTGQIRTREQEENSASRAYEACPLILSEISPLFITDTEKRL